MTLDELMTRFARNNGIELPKLDNGRYQIPLEGVAIECFQEADKVCLLTEVAPLATNNAQQQSQSRLLLEKTIGLIQEQRCVLTLDETSQSYQLYQRLPLQDLRLEVFQETVEKFGGCVLYYKNILGLESDGNSTPPVAGRMMP